MILIITHKLDYTVDFIVDILNTRKIPYKRLNCEDIMKSGLSISIGVDFDLHLLGEQVFSSIWFRRTMLPDVDMRLSEKIYLLKEFEYLLKNIFATIGGKWLSDPFLVYRAENKLLQLKYAKEIGFVIPETLVSAVATEIRDFANRQGSIIIKPIYSGRIESDTGPDFMFTNMVSEQHLADLEKYDITPCIFQQEIKKKIEIRVTVVGTEVFTAQVDSQKSTESKTDWRREKNKFEPFELPKNIAEMCVNLVEKLGLRFGAIDLILTPEGKYVFLEINPNGQWVWIETETGLKISDALINELTAEIE
jgi:glutathione synthase/RimK-type ligase-like ATP-grasp enzyme